MEVGGALYCRVFDGGHPERWQQQLAGRLVAVVAVAVAGLGSWESLTNSKCDHFGVGEPGLARSAAACHVSHPGNPLFL